MYIITKYCTVTIKELSVIYTAQSPTWRSITLRRLRLRAVLDNFGFSDILISWLGAVWYCDESDSAQYYTARSYIFSEYLHENEFFSESILDCLSGTQMGSLHGEKKMQNISWHCLFKKHRSGLFYLPPPTRHYEEYNLSFFFCWKAVILTQQCLINTAWLPLVAIGTGT